MQLEAFKEREAQKFFPVLPHFWVNEWRKRTASQTPFNSCPLCTVHQTFSRKQSTGYFQKSGVEKRVIKKLTQGFRHFNIILLQIKFWPCLQVRCPVLNGNLATHKNNKLSYKLIRFWNITKYIYMGHTCAHARTHTCNVITCIYSSLWKRWFQFAVNMWDLRFWRRYGWRCSSGFRRHADSYVDTNV